LKISLTVFLAEVAEEGRDGVDAAADAEGVGGDDGVDADAEADAKEVGEGAEVEVGAGPAEADADAGFKGGQGADVVPDPAENERVRAT